MQALRKLQDFLYGKSLIFGQNNLCLYIRFQKPDYSITASSWNTIEAVDDKIIEFGVERSQNNKITYFNFFRLRIYVYQFEVNKKSYLELVNLHRVPERYKNLVIEEIALNQSRHKSSLEKEEPRKQRPFDVYLNNNLNDNSSIKATPNEKYKIRLVRS